MGSVPGSGGHDKSLSSQLHMVGQGIAEQPPRLPRSPTNENAES